jgi:secreted PhoX family phosphatase
MPTGDFDRRVFLRRGAMGLGALWMVSLDEVLARGRRSPLAGPSPYGPLEPALDGTTGLPLLYLPSGFRYLTYSWTGDKLKDGTPCPGAHDGMAVIEKRANSNEIILVRNHEQNVGAAFTANQDLIFSHGRSGGTTNLVFDTERGEWKDAWASLAGTSRNCAGGVTPWGTWITGEEVPNEHGHGYCFEVGVEKGNPYPIMDMGRFSHEAVMVDPATGFVYETEDAGETSGFYKFVPNVPTQLHKGGELFMLKIKGLHNFDLGLGFPVGTEWDVEWVRVDDPRAATSSTFLQGQRRGAAKFQRLEGASWGDKSGFFVSTSGGAAASGQIFEYTPGGETLKLVYESPAKIHADYPDNVTVTPRGGLLCCEDSGNSVSPGERLLGITLDGTVFTFGMNNVVLTTARNAIQPRDYRASEFCGCCYSPDGKWLFVNTQTPGITFAITGPWGSGPL